MLFTVLGYSSRQRTGQLYIEGLCRTADALLTKGTVLSAVEKGRRDNCSYRNTFLLSQTAFIRP